MKAWLRTLGLIVALGLAFFPAMGRAQNDDSASFQTFYDQLAGQGTWIETQDYGYVFQPTENDPNWRPYTYGHWVNTDEGMTWDSDEPFGWATYHYGRWANLDNYGWVWVPGYTWAPAWVSWRDGDDEVGWAPLPPDSDVGIDYFDEDTYFTDADLDFGYHIGDDCDLFYGIGPGWYNFCPIVFIGDRDAWRHFHHRGDNYALVNSTRNVTNINFRRDGAGSLRSVTAEGPSVAALNARARTTIPQVQLASASTTGNAGLHGGTLGVYAPQVDPATRSTARPATIGETLAKTTVNPGTDINRPLAVNSRVMPVGATAEQVRAATIAQSNVPASARCGHHWKRNRRGAFVATVDLAAVGYGSAGRRPDANVIRGGRIRPAGGCIGKRVPGLHFRVDPSSQAKTAGLPLSPRALRSIIIRNQAFRTSAPAFRSSAPAYSRPESSFRSFAPAPHFENRCACRTISPAEISAAADDPPAVGDRPVERPYSGALATVIGDQMRAASPELQASACLSLRGPGTPRVRVLPGRALTRRKR